MKTNVLLMIFGAAMLTSCASVVSFNERYTSLDVTEPNAVYASPSTSGTQSDSQVYDSAAAEENYAASEEFFDDDHYYSRRLMTSYDPTWDVSFRIGGPYFSIGYYPF